MSSNFGRLARNTVAFQSLAGNIKVSAGAELIPLNEICSRFNNKYINNADKAKSLEMSIRENGLIEPIVVVSIDEYLSKVETSEEESSFLSKFQSNGVKYFISSGHRRFKAYVSIAINRTILTNEDLFNFYDEFNALYKDYLDEREYAMMNGEEIPDGRWFQIPCRVATLEEADEAAIYNDSNTTQRELTGFELVANVLDEMQANGEWERALEKAKKDKIMSLKSRALRSTYDALRLEQKVRSIDTSLASNRDDQYREVLLEVDPKLISGLDTDINESVRSYLLEKKQRNVSRTVVNYARKVIDTFDKRVVDTIYDGLLTFKDAKEILPSYDTIDVDELLVLLKNGEFTIETLPKKGKKLNFSKSDLIELIYDVKNGKKTIDEVIELINQK